jgi:hypothetical protein
MLSRLQEAVVAFTKFGRTMMGERQRRWLSGVVTSGFLLRLFRVTLVILRTGNENCFCYLSVSKQPTALLASWCQFPLLCLPNRRPI